MTDIVADWLAKYRIAWASNDPDDIRALFTEDATYAFSPFDSEPLSGREAIVAGWLESPDAPEDWSFEAAPLHYHDGLGFIQGYTKYSDGREYANLFIVQFADDGRATSFVEWYMKAPDKD